MRLVLEEAERFRELTYRWLAASPRYRFFGGPLESRTPNLHVEWNFDYLPLSCNRALAGLRNPYSRIGRESPAA
jgi:hypothetical protein